MRTASFEGGVLEFDRPVLDLLVGRYKHFYLIRTPNGVRLASQKMIRRYVIGKDPKDWSTWIVNEKMLIKKEPN
jgi:hypothetical protein